MKNIEEKELQKLLQNEMLQKAPEGMIDRVMAHIAVIPAHRISVKPIEPNPALAFIISLSTIALVIIGLVAKPTTYYSIHIPWEAFISFNINPIWISPLLLISITIWGYILISKKKKSSAINHVT